MNLFLTITGYQVCQCELAGYLRFKVFYSLSNSLDFFGLFIRNGDIKLFLKFHNQFYSVERVRAQILNKVGFGMHFAFVHTKFVNNNFFDTFGYSCHVL